MANREALRQLQSRLAQRLQEARTVGVQASWLAVECAGRKLLFPLTQAGEIFPPAQPQPVPYTQPWFLGVANLRGGLYGVVDLALFLDGKPAKAHVDTSRAESRLVAFNAVLEINCALLVERLAGLRGADAFASSALAPAGAPAFFGSTYMDANGEQWQEINLQALSQQPHFLGITA